MKNQLERTLTAAICIPISLLVIYYSNNIVFYILLEIVIYLSIFEFLKMLALKHMKYITFPILLFPLCLPIVIYIGDFNLFLITFITLLFLTLIIKLFSSNPLDATFESVGTTLLVIFYSPFLLSFLFPLKLINTQYIFFVLFVIWLSDSFAYIFGSLYGKKRLYEKISPKKTIVGLFASFIGGFLCAFLYNQLFLKIDFTEIFCFALLIIISGVLGDLVESMFKRYCGIKDSGKLFPGHGGLLDRIDSLLFAFPISYIYIVIRLN